MQLSEIEKPQVHDLLQIDPDLLNPGFTGAPSWVKRTLRSCRWMVGRRAQAPFGQVAVGVRANTRNKRWGGFFEESLVSRVVRPAELRVLGRSPTRTPALRALTEASSGGGLHFAVGGQLGASDLNWQADAKSQPKSATLILQLTPRTGSPLSKRTRYWNVSKGCKLPNQPPCGPGPTSMENSEYFRNPSESPPFAVTRTGRCVPILHNGPSASRASEGRSCQCD